MDATKLGTCSSASYPKPSSSVHTTYSWQYQLAYEMEKLSELQRQVAVQEQRLSSLQQQSENFSASGDTTG